MATNTYAMAGSGGFQGGGPGQRVNPGNDAFGGGSLTRASNPVQANGAFTTPSAAGGPPPSFGTPAMAFARNDRGSNIRIPYARVVSMHAQDRLPVDDPALTGTGRNDAYEYDGLEPAELAWVMSKQFSIKPSFRQDDGSYAGGAAGEANASFTSIASPIDVSSFGGNAQGATDAIRNSAGGEPRFGLRGMDGAVIVPSAGMGGAGVNRMERMAYTRWVEAFFKHKVGRQLIDLVGARVSADTNGDALGRDVRSTDNYNTALDSEIEFWSRCWRYPRFVGVTVRGTDTVRADVGSSGPALGGSLFAMPDIAYMLQAVTPGAPLQVPVPQMQGLYLMEKGPFLRSYGVSHDPVSVELDNLGDRAGYGRKLQVEVDRHLGSDLAQRALLCELKKAGILNWTPDGICLSKDHTGGPGDPNDQYFDARLGQLFNIGVQGPCITKTWSNLGPTEGINASNSDLVTMPMDKVFILVVGELSYELEDDASEETTLAAELTAAIARQEFQTVSIRPGATGEDATDLFRGNMLASVLGPVDAEQLPDRTQNDGQDRVDKLKAQLDERIRLLNLYAKKVEEKAMGSLQTADRTGYYKAFRNLLKAVRDAETSEASTDERRKALKKAEESLARVTELVGQERRDEVAGNNFKRVAAQVRSGKRGIKKAELMNFRLMRATSSYLSNKSHFKADDPRSRCGLKIGYCHDGAAGSAGFEALQDELVPDVFEPGELCPALSGNAEYIVGGWCIGTVVDSAASRALGHNGIRSAPSTYAINVNVNVEWWNADKLYSHYQDKERDAPGQEKPEGTTFMRTINHYRTPGVVMGEERKTEDEAVQQLRSGANDAEGIYKQPNPYGADTDPKRIGRAGRDGKGLSGQDDFDPRVWVAAAGSAANATAAATAAAVGEATAAHAARLGL
jgi:hypothetical protein